MEGQRRVYKCRKCGQPKKGHVCTYDESAAEAEGELSKSDVRGKNEEPEDDAHAKRLGSKKKGQQKKTKGQPSGQTTEALPRYFVVLDLEATCDDDWNRNFYPQEIIEFSAVLLNAGSHEVEDSFQVYVKPLVHPVLTPFCHSLTGIHQEWVDNGVSLQECLQLFHVWLERHDLLPHRPAHLGTAGQPAPFWIVTWSDWDLGTMLESQCIRTCLDKEPYFSQWVDLKQLYMRYYSMKFRVKLSDAVASVGLSWQGEEHCALDDCRNTGRLLSKVIEHGHAVRLTSALPQAT